MELATRSGALPAPGQQSAGGAGSASGVILASVSALGSAKGANRWTPSAELLGMERGQAKNTPAPIAAMTTRLIMCFLDQKHLAKLWVNFIVVILFL